MHSPLQKNPPKIKQNNKQTKSEKNPQAIITLMWSCGMMNLVPFVKSYFPILVFSYERWYMYITLLWKCSFFKIRLKVAERLFHNPQFVLLWAHVGYCVILIQRLNLTAFAVKHMEHPWKLDKSKSASNLW